MAADWSQLTGFFIGIGLSAACGFRLILPFLGLGIAARCGLVGLAPEFQWIAAWPALVAFATAALDDCSDLFLVDLVNEERE